MKNLFKFLKKLVNNFWVRLVFLLGVVTGILAIGGAFKSRDTIGEKLLEIITSVDVISIFLIAAVSLIVANIVFKVKHVLEESMKIEDDHHKIICKYNKHEQSKVDKSKNHCVKSGEIMDLYNVVKKRKRPDNPIKDKFSDEYETRKRDIDLYMKGQLLLPSVCVFINVLGDVTVKFDDKPSFFELPTFVTENKLQLMEAHKTSNVRNGETIRLNDFSFENNTLTLDTARTQYYDMLVTNRCMDFELNDAVTVREMYEYGDAVNELGRSVLANQIGINGLIFTENGYLLLEKRGRKKTTWKDKFAQPISLAMKRSDIKFPLGTDTIASTPKAANDVFAAIIHKTVKKNFGLTPDELLPFDMSVNFLGIARDLLEGGKPNLYFYVVTKYTAEELVAVLEEKSKRFGLLSAEERKSAKDIPTLTRDKLDSDFYLVDYSDIFIDYDYALRLKSRDILRVKRKFAPRVNRLVAARDGSAHRLRRAFGLDLKKECGEALLACLYFTNVCSDRISAQLGVDIVKEEQ